MELEDTNPWPRRIILVGAGFFIIASIAWLSNADSINQVFDPRESATQQTNGDGIHNIVLDEGCWTITSIGQIENLNVSVFEIEGPLWERRSQRVVEPTLSLNQLMILNLLSLKR